MLKVDLHLHTCDDEKDVFIKHTAKQLIDHAAQLKYDVITITNHDTVTDVKPFVRYAKKKGIVFIPGIEKTINNHHVLLYNFTKQELARIKTLQDLRTVKKAHHLVVAPHPFYPLGFALKHELEHYIDVFDAIEYSQFYLGVLNFNRKAARFAKEHGLAILGNSDSHALWQLGGTTYTLVRAKPTVRDIIRAIKQKKTRLVTRPLPFLTFAKVCVFLLWPRKGQKPFK